MDMHENAPENACFPLRQRLCGAGRMLVRLANIACAAREQRLCASKAWFSGGKNTVSGFVFRRFRSISTVSISLFAYL
ncbi:hypothetical protein [uncultured Bacteroides sp.]|uniref:hypothetical protein n=1 Tax=uncultured Bacteroides sp. TaxID=162156 RepID=UPI0025997885|nr:hypothetical protein [uncultured Bacteroides sp.]